MKWEISHKTDEMVTVTEREEHPGKPYRRDICLVLRRHLLETNADREAMLATAQEIVDAHNMKQPYEEPQ